ncbi:MAG: hypothetical protein ACUVWP_08430 [bacterium]
MFNWKITSKEYKVFINWLIDTGTKPNGCLWRLPEKEDLGIYHFILVDDMDKVLNKI